MSPMRFNARLDMSHHGPPHPFKDGGAVADTLTGIHSAMVKCQQELHTHGCVGVPTGKNTEDSSPVSVEAMQYALLCLSIGHYIENISQSAANMRWSAIMHSFSHNSQTVSGHMLIWTFFLVFVCGSRAQSSFIPFSYTLYILHTKNRTWKWHTRTETCRPRQQTLPAGNNVVLTGM
jgi:hypothetical protein